MSGTVTLFDIESKKSHDPEEHLYRTMKKMKPTIQEAVISKILTDLQLQYITQWIIRFNDRNFVFDFLVEPNMVIECTFTDRTPSAVISWLQSRALVLDNKFKALKTSVPYENVSLMFLESTRLSPTKLKANIHDLEYTDKLITSINEFEAFMGEWKQTQVVQDDKESPKPTAEVEVSAWAVKDPQSTLERFI